MIEKKLVEILDPVVDQLVALEKRIEAVQLTPGPAGADGRDGVDGKDADPAEVAEKIKADAAYRAALKGDPGEPGRDGADGKDAAPEAVSAVLKADDEFVARLKGEPGEPGADGRDGRDGADGKSVTAQEVADYLIEHHLDLLRGATGERGEKGDQGDRGADGRDGADADVDAVARALAANEAFVKAISNVVEQEPWAPGIYREGKCVTHYVGRSYQAVCDTTEEPGDSAHWKRLGTLGMRDVGGFDAQRAYEPGDVYHKDGSTFWFDGVNHRLTNPKPFTERDYEKAQKALRSTITETLKAVVESNKELRAHNDGLQAQVDRLEQIVAELADQIKKQVKK